MFRRRRDEAFDPLDDVRAVLLAPEDPTAGDDLALLRRIAAEAVIVQDDVEHLLDEIRDRCPLAELAPRGGRLTSHLVELAERLPESRNPRVRAYTRRLREILDHHALMLSASLKLFAVSWRSDNLEAEVDRIDGLGPPAQWLEDLRAELLADR